MRTIPIAICLISSVCFGARPVIFDTDMGNDVDDALALAMLHSLSDRGECALIGVTLTNANPAAVPYIRMIDRFYGRPDLPVGAAIRDLKDGSGDGYLTAALRAFPAESSTPAEPALPLLRRLLSSAREKVVIVQTGFSTNLAALLDSPDGVALAREKVALVVVMAGNFTGGEPEYNVRTDIASAKSVFERWPTPVIFSGFEIGRDLLYPAASIEHDFAYANPHPIAESYRAYHHMPYDRPTWDLTAVLQAVRPEHDYFGLSEPGRVSVEANGVTHFVAGQGDRQYLKLDPSKRTEILEVLTLLASQPPARK
jgi:inosine-uridine nucleoside N-ribohydrolase